MLKKIINSAALASLFMTGVVSAQTTTATTTTPGLPNTGQGDVLQTALMLGLSVMIAMGGALYLYYVSRESLGTE